MHRARGHHDDRDDRHRHHDHRHRDDDRHHQHHHASPSGRAQQSQQSRHRDLADHRADLRLFKPSVPPPATPSSQISPVSEALTRLGSQLSAADDFVSYELVGRVGTTAPRFSIARFGA